jgi:hypothetical protein
VAAGGRRRGDAHECILQADGFSGFNGLYESGRIREAGCWAHARRKFYEQFETNRSPVAKEALDRIQALYAIEEAVRRKLPAERVAVCQRDAVPLLASLEAWMRARLVIVSAKSAERAMITLWAESPSFCLGTARSF